MEEELEGRPVESPGRAVFRGGLMTFGTRLAIVLVNIPTSILVARLLGVEGQGLYTSGIIMPTLFAFAGLLSIDAAHTYLLSKKEYRPSQINGQALILACVLSLAVAAVYLVFLRFYEPAREPELGSILTLAVLLIPVLLLKYMGIAFLLGLQRIKHFNLANFVQAGTLLLFMCVNLFVVRGGAKGAVVAYLASEVTVTLIAFLVARREAGSGALIEMPPPGLFKRSAIYGLQGHVGNILVLFTYRFDMFLVLSIAGLRAQGLYSIAVILAEKLSHIPDSVKVVLFPKLASLETEDANALTPRVTRNSLFLTAVAGLVLYLLSRPLLILFYGTEFIESLRAFQILIPGVVFLAVGKILSTDFSGRDKRLYYTLGTGIAFAVNVVLCLLWIPSYGIVGAAWASTAAYALQAVIMLVFFKRLSGRGMAETVFLRGEDFALYGELMRRLLRR
jgi:O-antigen/teichoic acid export membrane protein